MHKKQQKPAAWTAFPLTEGEAVQAVHLGFQSNNLQWLTQQETYLCTGCAKKSARVWPFPCPLPFDFDCRLLTSSAFPTVVSDGSNFKGNLSFWIESCTCNHGISMVSHAACMIWHRTLCNHTGKCKHAGHYICVLLYVRQGLSRVAVCSTMSFWGNQMLVAACTLPQQTAVGSARFNIGLPSTHHPLQSYVVWIDCPAMYADTRFTAQMTSLSTIRHHRCDKVLRVLGDATCVQGHVSLIENFVHDLKLLQAFIFLLVIV